MRNPILLFAIFLFLAGLLTLFLVPQSSLVSPEPRANEERIIELSLEKQVSQMLIIGFEGTKLSPELATFIREIQPGGVLLLGRNIEDKEQVKTLVGELQKISQIPLFVAVDQEGGEVSRISWGETTSPSQLKDRDHAFLIGEERAQGLREIGINMNLAPVIDSKNPSDFVFPRFVQKDDVRSLQVLDGLIAGHLSKGVVVVPKHFPGYDTISFNPESSVIPRVSRVPDTSLFEELFANTALPLVMASHVVFEDLDKDSPFPFSQAGIALLKEKLGQDLLIMSDDLLSRAMVKGYPISAIGGRAMTAGVDILLAAGYQDTNMIPEFYEGLLKEVKENPVLQGKLREAVLRILEKKKELMVY